MSRLKVYLANLSLARLREICLTLQISFDDYAGKPKLLEQVAARLTDPSVTEAIVRSLPQDQAEALALLGQHKGKLPVEEARRRLPSAPDDVPSPSSDSGDPPPIAALMRLGLMFRGFDVVGGFETPVYLVPDEIVPLLPQAQTPLPIFTMEAIAAPARHRDDQVDLLRDVVALLSFCRGSSTEEEAGGRLSQEAVHRLDSRFLRTSTEDQAVSPAWSRTQFVYNICRRVGLLAVQNRVVCPTDDKRVRAWLARGHQECLSDLWRAWRTDVAWNELLMDGRVRQERGPRLPLSEARRSLLTHLERCVGLGWIQMSSLETAVQNDSPGFLRPARAGRQWEMVHTESGRALNNSEDWRHVEGRFIRSCIDGPLTWLGVVAVGESNGRRCFSVTAIGGALLAGEPSSAGRWPSERLLVQSDFEVLAPYWCPLDGVYALEEFAEARRHDRIAAYELTQQSVSRAFQIGMTVEQMLETLGAAAPQSVPDIVVETLRDWWDRFGKIRIRRAYLLDSTDAVTLEEIRATPRLRPLLGVGNSSGCIEIQPSQLDDLIAALVEEGVVPDMHLDDAPTAHAPSQPDILNLLAATEVLIELAGAQDWPTSLNSSVSRTRARLDRPALNLLQAKREYLLRLVRRKTDVVSDAVDSVGKP